MNEVGDWAGWTEDAEAAAAEAGGEEAAEVHNGNIPDMDELECWDVWAVEAEDVEIYGVDDAEKNVWQIREPRPLGKRFPI